MERPTGYREPMLACLVEFVDERDAAVVQVGGFTSLTAAQACVVRLEAEGLRGLRIKTVALHDRLEDWQFDR